jgi:hypothetical protein
MAHRNIIRLHDECSAILCWIVFKDSQKQPGGGRGGGCKSHVNNTPRARIQAFPFMEMPMSTTLLYKGLRTEMQVPHKASPCPCLPTQALQRFKKAKGSERWNNNPNPVHSICNAGELRHNLMTTVPKLSEERWIQNVVKKDSILCGSLGDVALVTKHI